MHKPAERAGCEKSPRGIYLLRLDTHEKIIIFIRVQHFGLPPADALD